MIDVIAFSFAGTVGISVFFAVMLQQNIYYSLLFLQPAIIVFVVLGFEWLNVHHNQILMLLMIVVFLSFITIGIVFTQKYMKFHYSEAVENKKNKKGKQ